MIGLFVQQQRLSLSEGWACFRGEGSRNCDCKGGPTGVQEYFCEDYYVTSNAPLLHRLSASAVFWLARFPTPLSDPASGCASSTRTVRSARKSFRHYKQYFPAALIASAMRRRDAIILIGAR